MDKKSLLVIVVSILSPLFAYSQSSNKNTSISISHTGNKTDTTYTDVRQSSSKGTFIFLDKFPQFQGDLEKYCHDHLQYPDDAKKKNISGKVTVGFTLDKEGHISRVHVLKKLYPSLDSEAVRLVKNMPAWKPAIRDGAPVKTDWVVQIVFK